MQSTHKATTHFDLASVLVDHKEISLYEHGFAVFIQYSYTLKLASLRANRYLHNIRGKNHTGITSSLLHTNNEKSPRQPDFLAFT